VKSVLLLQLDSMKFQLLISTSCAHWNCRWTY